MESDRVAQAEQTETFHTPPTYGMRPGAEKFPLMMHIVMAYPCNAKCPSCPFTETNSNIRALHREEDTNFIPMDVFKRTADECGKHGALMRLTGGGEPMLHPKFMEMVLYAKRAGAGVGLITNGSRLTPDRVERMLKAGVDCIEVSIDAADKETYKIVRPGLDWDNVLGYLKHAVKRRNEMGYTSRIIVSVIDQVTTHDQMDKIKAFWEGIVDYVIIRKYLTWDTSPKERAGDATPFLGDKTPCPFPFERFLVDVQGTFRLCGYDIWGKEDFGDIRKNSIEAMWNSEKMVWWRKQMLEGNFDAIPMCRDCSDRKYRSWNFNYLKTLEGAEKKRQEAVRG